MSAACFGRSCVSLSVLGLLCLVACSGDDPTGASAGTTSGAAAASSDGDATTADGVSASETSAGFSPYACGFVPGFEGSACPTDRPLPPVKTYVVCSPGASCDSLMCDKYNCGECGHACLAGCVDGACSSTQSECLQPDDGVTTCAEACARVGAVCETELEPAVGQCGRGYVWALESQADGGSFGPACPYLAQFVEGTRYEAVGCDEPIRWDHGSVDDPQAGVKCCCKGDLL